MTTSCSMRGCDAPAVSTVAALADRQPVCFDHEVELIERYDWAMVAPRPLVFTPTHPTVADVLAAVAALQGAN